MLIRIHSFALLMLAAVAYLPCDEIVADEIATESPQAVRVAGLEFVFATPEQGRAVLGSRDTFVEQMSPFDRMVRMRSDEDPGEAAFLRFASDEVRPWESKEREAIMAAIQALEKRLPEIELPDLGQVLLIHTSGKEESGAAYTRGKAIILPAGQTGSNERPRVKLLAHELFHVLSRHDHKLRDRLYQRLGFRPSGPISLPKDLQKRKLTNPDAPSIEHVMNVQIDKETTVTVAPVLYAKRPYDRSGNPSLFSYLEFKLMEVMPNVSKSFIPKMLDGAAVMHDPTMPDFHRQIGRNTGYIVHPEEILADNFAILVTGSGNIRDQWVIDALKKELESSEDQEDN